MIDHQAVECIAVHSHSTGSAALPAAAAPVPAPPPAPPPPEALGSRLSPRGPAAAAPRADGVAWPGRWAGGKTAGSAPAEFRKQQRRCGDTGRKVRTLEGGCGGRLGD